jgi:hypothetical protein
MMSPFEKLILATFVTVLGVAIMIAFILRITRIGQPQDDSDMPDYVSPEERAEVDRLRHEGWL